MRPHWARWTCAPRALAAAVSLGTFWTSSAREVAEVFAQAAPAVVRVKVITEDPDENGKPRAVIHVSSGFFIDDAGRVLTAIGDRGALARAVRKLVEWKGVSFPAELKGYDPTTGIALLQVLRLPDGFGAIPVSPPEGRLPIGSTVLSITTPIAVPKLIELPPTPVLGLVTGYESSIATLEFPFTYLRSDIPLRGDEVGAAVVDLDGEIVGIVVLSVNEVRSSYLVPSAALTRIVADLADRGEVAYRTLPLEFTEQVNAGHTALEVVVSEVEPGSSAAKADIRVNDVVRRIGTTAVERIRDVRDALFFTKAGEYAQIEVERGGSRLNWVLPVEEASAPRSALPRLPAERPSVTRPEGASESPAPESMPPPYLEALEQALAPKNN